MSDPFERSFLRCELPSVALGDMTAVTLNMADLFHHPHVKSLRGIQELNAHHKTSPFWTAPYHSRRRHLEGGSQMRYPQSDDHTHIDLRI